MNQVKCKIYKTVAFLFSYCHVPAFELPQVIIWIISRLRFMFIWLWIFSSLGNVPDFSSFGPTGSFWVHVEHHKCCLRTGAMVCSVLSAALPWFYSYQRDQHCLPWYPLASYIFNILTLYVWRTELLLYLIYTSTQKQRQTGKFHTAKWMRCLWFVIILSWLGQVTRALSVQAQYPENRLSRDTGHYLGIRLCCNIFTAVTKAAQWQKSNCDCDTSIYCIDHSTWIKCFGCEWSDWWADPWAVSHKLTIWYSC